MSCENKHTEEDETIRYTLTNVSADTLDVSEDILQKISYFDSLLKMRDVMSTGISVDNVINIDMMDMILMKVVIKYVSHDFNESYLLRSLPENKKIDDLL
jgi:hypothetical protein